MWKLKNDKNKKYLLKFRQELIEPLMINILRYKWIREFTFFSEYVNSDKFLGNRDLFKKMMNIKVNNETLLNCIEEISKNNFMYLVEQYLVYKEQTLMLDNLDYNIEEKKVDVVYAKIFSKFFYEKFFGQEEVWKLINSDFKNYSRKKFHYNLKEENDIQVCPYCDIDTIISEGNQVIEHFMPRCKYPYLSMHPNNLISACSGCNGAYGKLKKYYIPITAPYKEQIGDKIHFDLNYNDKKVLLDAKGQIEICNFIKLVKLDKKYEQEQIFNRIKAKSEKIFRLCNKYEKNIGEGISEELFEDYLEFKKDPLTFATKEICGNIIKYESFKKNK